LFDRELNTMVAEIDAKKRRVIELGQYLNSRDEALSMHLA